MGSNQMKTRLVLVTLVLLVFFEMSQCFTLSKSENGQGSLTTKKSQNPRDMASVLLRQKRMSHISLCLYCCGCCKTSMCGFCCKI
ncbi:hepcidin-1-like [Rhincodon typus]|uniref:hepcidin-1-like n=1 Tax=Rhincodon typus TaxID=259920 RepID=UPI002030A797|nr:hepcidin-1-like [Rhincodon typus]